MIGHHHNAVVFDIDGVLADCSRRVAAINRTFPDWDAFHADQVNDPVRPGETAVLRALYPHHFVVLLTNRHEKYRADTINWLNANRIPFDLLLMREERGVEGYRSSKLWHLHHLADKYKINVIFEDDPLLVEEMRARDYPVMYVHSGYYEQEDRIEVGAHGTGE